MSALSDYDSSFSYVDFHYMKGEIPTKWRRVALVDLPAHVAEAHGFNAYASVQRYATAVIPPSGTEEVHYCPPYADFDSADLAESQRDARRLIDFAKDAFELTDEQIRVWFSGRKGFHVLLSPTAFGVVPMADLSYVYGAMFGHIKEFLNLPSLDMSVYSRRRMLRIENTVHAKSGLYKRELDHDEITLAPDDILELARTPLLAPVVSPDDFDGESTSSAVQFFEEFRAEYAAKKEAKDSASRVVLHPEAAPGEDPVCVQDILGGGIKKPGDRNRATLSLGGYFKDTGKSLAYATETLSRWALNLPPEHRNPDDNHVRANTASVLRTVYESDGYGFGCKFMRSLHGPKTSPAYERVACMGDACPFIRGIEPEVEVLDVHLSRIGDPMLLGRTVRTKLRVAGRQESAYLVPAQVEYRAIDDGDECKRPHCLLHQMGGRIERDFSSEANTRVLLAMCGVSDQQLMVVLRREIEKVACKSFAVEVKGHVKVIAMTCVPKAESFVFDESDKSVKDESGGDFAYQRVYSVMQDFKVNSYYEVTGQVFSHPKDQEATLVVTDATPTQDAIEDFDLAAARPLFKAYEGDPMAVFGHLVADLGVNVCKVAGRQAALAALLMTVHSPLTLNFAGQSYGGWMQTLMVGDTGEAKSQMVERIVRFIGLGELQSAQSSGRTGLLYSIIMPNGGHNFLQWGSFVMNDRRLLVIDEASGIDKAGYAELRNARRDGIFKVNRVVSGEAQTRTRLLVLSNPQYGRNMNEFRAGIECVEFLFENADIRRFDLVVGFRHGSVTQDMIDAQLAERVEHIFDRDVLRANVLWAWSRTPEQIVWAPGAQAKVKTVAHDLNRRYAGSDIHLLSQDAPEKVARMSQALAAMLHSTDASHANVVIRPEHVELVAQLVDAIYSAPDLDYELYVKQNADTTNDVDYDDLLAKINARIAYPFGLASADLIEFFSSNRTISTQVIEAFTEDRRSAAGVVRNLLQLQLIHTPKYGAGFEPTARFKELMRRYNRSRSGGLGK